MKNLMLFFTVLLIIAGCSKSSSLPAINPNAWYSDSGCIERFRISVNAHSISQADVATIDNLFASNNIDHTSFRYYRYIHDSLHTQYPPYTVYDQKSLRCDKYTNGVRILNGDLVFLFLSDQFSHMGGHLTGGTSLDTLPLLQIGQLRKMYLDDMERFDHNSALFRDTCLKAEFGYYNLNAGTSNATENLVKAWRVTPKYTVFPGEYPVAYYKDQDSRLIYYHNGIIF